MGERTTVDLLQGTLGVLVLKSLSWGDLHGYGIARWIERTAGRELLIDEGSLYPTLHRLEARRFVTSCWTLSETNRRVKTYAITDRGRVQLRAEVSRWDGFSAAVSAVLHARSPRTA